MGTNGYGGIDERRRQAAEISLQVQDANRYLQNARAQLDQAAGLLAVVDYVVRADAASGETAAALKDVFEQVEACAGNAAKQALEISQHLPSDRDLRQTYGRVGSAPSPSRPGRR